MPLQIGRPYGGGPREMKSRATFRPQAVDSPPLLRNSFSGGSCVPDIWPPPCWSLLCFARARNPTCAETTRSVQEDNTSLNGRAQTTCQKTTCCIASKRQYIIAQQNEWLTYIVITTAPKTLMWHLIRHSCMTNLLTHGLTNLTLPEPRR